MPELPMKDAYAAAFREVGLLGTEVAAQRYRRAVDAALAVLRPHIEAGALRKAADAAERVTIVYDQDSDDGWRKWMRERADELSPVGCICSTSRLDYSGAPVTQVHPDAGCPVHGERSQS